MYQCPRRACDFQRLVAINIETESEPAPRDIQDGNIQESTVVLNDCETGLAGSLEHTAKTNDTTLSGVLIS